MKTLFTYQILGLALLFSILLPAQEFTFELYFEDALGQRDTLTLGLDEGAQLGIDPHLEEVNIIDQAWGDGLEVRVTDELYNRASGYPQGFYHSKREIIDPFNDPNIITIDIKSNAFPITASWDSTLFSSRQLDGSLFTSVNPGGWWDVGSPSNLHRIFFARQSSVTFSDNVRDNGAIYLNYAYTNETDTLSCYWLAFGAQGIGVYTTESPQDKLQISPNPSTDYLHLTTTGNWSGDFLLRDSYGRVVWQGVLPTAPLDVSHLAPGMYYLAYFSADKYWRAQPVVIMR